LAQPTQLRVILIELGRTAEQGALRVAEGPNLCAIHPFFFSGARNTEMSIWECPSFETWQLPHRLGGIREIKILPLVIPITRLAYW
jgi:hypothetical protein